MTHLHSFSSERYIIQQLVRLGLVELGVLDLGLLELG